MNKESTIDIDEIFKKYFQDIGESIRPIQRKVIESVLDGHNTLCLMPTGAGKSLCYWVAGKSLGGITIVVSPLTALMDEQADKLNHFGLSTLCLHSGIDAQQQYKALIGLMEGNHPDYIFISPERLATDGFVEYVLRLQSQHIKLVAVDEIHCVSQWGHDFRPFYKEIPLFLDNISDGQWPTVLGLTATLNEQDRGVICKDFRIHTQHVICSEYLLRLPIELQIVKVEDEDEKDQQFWELLERHRDDKVLIYQDRKQGRRSVEQLAAEAQELGFAAAYFHGDMSSNAKADVISKFKDGSLRTVFATSAFGMGIDVKDIRVVIHYRPPESIEQYYQQIGRAGRDYRPAQATLFYSTKNIEIRRSHFIDRSFPSEEKIRDAFTEITHGRGNLKTINVFENEKTRYAYHYLLNCDALRFVCKGVRNLKIFESIIPLPQFDSYLNASKTGNMVMIVHKTSIIPKKLMNDVYGWLATKQIRIVRNRRPEKCLLIEQMVPDLTNELIDQIMDDVGKKQQYRHGLLDEFVEILEEYSGSLALHQQIGRYLGIDDFQLGRIHETVSGIMVRSKSEVIIANLLTRHDIPFQYEQHLTADGVTFLPDFTIEWKGKVYFLEHLGRLDLESYRQNWAIKQEWYEKNFPGQLLTTKETSILSHEVERLIKKHFLPDLVISKYPSVEPSPIKETISKEPIETYKAQIWTEGRTDWKHLKAAYHRLRAADKFVSLDLVFSEDESDMGDKELLNMCRAYSRMSQTIPTFFIFDRDVSSTLKKVIEAGQDFKDWDNGVFSVVLPIPDHRQDMPDICIEFYYHDSEITQTDTNGRRLFISNEFSDRSGRHEKEPIICNDLNKIGRFTIIDDKVFDSQDENIALSKNRFANYILKGVDGFNQFDLSAFEKLFTLIESLVATNHKNKTQNE